MARGAWQRAMVPAIAAAGVEIDTDPFGLFYSSREVIPYDPAIAQAWQDGIGTR